MHLFFLVLLHNLRVPAEQDTRRGGEGRGNGLPAGEGEGGRGRERGRSFPDDLPLFSPSSSVVEVEDVDGASQLPVRVPGDPAPLLAGPDDEARSGEGAGRGRGRRRRRRVASVSFVAAPAASPCSSEHEGDPALARAGSFQGLSPVGISEEDRDQRAEERHEGQGQSGEEDEAPACSALLSGRRRSVVNRRFGKQQRRVVASPRGHFVFVFKRERLWRGKQRSLSPLGEGCSRIVCGSAPLGQGRWPGR